MLPLDKGRAIEKVLHMTALGKALDFGNYTPVPTPDQVRCWLGQGYTKAIVGTSYPRDNGDGTYTWIADDQIAVCLANGMDVETYCFPTRIKPEHPYWLDAETPAATVAAIRAICAGPTPPIGIYTRRTWWTAETGDWQIAAEFPFLRLWDANYGDPPPAFAPYGGWTARAMHQWHDSTTLCGLNVDLNIIEEGGRMYSDADIDAKVGAVLTQLVTTQQNVNELANGIDAVSVNNKWPLSLKGLWFVAGKAWPFGGR